MMEIARLVSSRPHVDRMSLEELFAEAEMFGECDIYCSKGEQGRYRAKITFQTPAGIDLTAKSGFGMPILDAMRQAVDAARKIAEQMK